MRGKRIQINSGSTSSRITPAGAGKTRFRPPTEARDRDHPRRCGENRLKRGQNPRRRGSPPQVRGKQSIFLHCSASPRITPAGAGKTNHPQGFDLLRRGSPPQVRGKPRYNVGIYVGQGITPAGAGKTCDIIFAYLPHEDHPRRCGENFAAFLNAARILGSPPQVRGKPITEAFKADIDRITPAGAGKTKRRNMKIINAWDHPRRCGENVRVKNPIRFQPGSPPQVRGKQPFFYLVDSVLRITPAGAGKTLKRSFRNQPFCS